MFLDNLQRVQSLLLGELGADLLDERGQVGDVLRLHKAVSLVSSLQKMQAPSLETLGIMALYASKFLGSSYSK